jgi:hypothetical protein
MRGSASIENDYRMSTRFQIDKGFGFLSPFVIRGGIVVPETAV